MKRSKDKQLDFESTAVRVSAVSIGSNAILSVFKLLSGLLAHSTAMVSDAVHSASDVLSSVIVIIAVKLSARASDPEHPYGHERFECVAAVLLSFLLLLSGLFIGFAGVEKLLHPASGNVRSPGAPALAAAAVSIAVKEAMYWYTRYYAKRLNAGSLMADAWHHRSDALSSVGALIGIAFARHGYPVADPAASLLLCVFIAKAAYDIFKDAVNKMVDHSCNEETEQAIRQCVLGVDGVKQIDKLQTRLFGNRIYADIEIGADAEQTLRQGHAVAQSVHNEVEAKFPDVKHIMVHVNPWPPDDACGKENRTEEPAGKKD